MSIQVGIAQAGPVQIELIQQHCDRPSIFRDWPSPFHQLRDGDVRLRRPVATPAAVLRVQGWSGDRRVARVGYVDTVADFEFYTEVVSSNPTFFARWDQVSQTSATWDMPTRASCHPRRVPSPVTG